MKIFNLKKSKLISIIEYLIVFFVILLLIVLYVLKNTNYIDYFSVDIVDDIIHDKYEKNTMEYYNYRINRDENLLKSNSWNLILYDNLAVWYDHIWNLEKALEIYKTKKELMDKCKYDMLNRYRYYANLWTFFIHDWAKGWFVNKNDNKSQKLIIQGRNYIKKAIEINVNAHFWRENYQLIANNWIIDSFTNPSVMVSENMLWKVSLDYKLLYRENSRESCWENYYDIYPETKKVGKNIDEQIKDSCPMALKWVIWMIRFWWWPNPFSFSTIWDILVLMGEYKIAFASYARAIEMKHPNSEKIKEYMLVLSQRIYPNLSNQVAYDKLFNQFKIDYRLWNDWAEKYLKYQKNIILEWKDPTQLKSYDEFYKKFKHPIDVKYNR